MKPSSDSGLESSKEVKRSLNPSGSKKGSIVWDEKNLEENERIKAELIPCKINEPKTPYQPPLPDGDLDDLEPLSLDGEDPAQSNGCPASMETKEPVAAVQTDGSAGAQPEHHETHQEFEDHRKAHYNMKEAMMRAKQMMDEEDDK
eukprot:gene21339-28274_t